MFIVKPLAILNKDAYSNLNLQSNFIFDNTLNMLLNLFKDCQFTNMVKYPTHHIPNTNLSVRTIESPEIGLRLDWC